LPKPIKPSCFLCNSIPKNCDLSHSFFLTELLATVTFLAAEIIKPTVNSAAEITLASGVFVT